MRYGQQMEFFFNCILITLHVILTNKIILQEQVYVYVYLFLFNGEDRVTYRKTQTVDFILRLTGDFFQAFGVYFHQIKQPFAITNFFRPLDVQGSSAKCFQWSA